LLGLGPRLIKKEFTGPWSHKGWETLSYAMGTVVLARGNVARAWCWPLTPTERQG